MLGAPVWLLALVVAALAPLVVGAFVAGLEKRVQRRTLRVLAQAQIPRGPDLQERNKGGGTEHADEG
jgi:hypothetical protein